MLPYIPFCGGVECKRIQSEFLPAPLAIMAASADGMSSEWHPSPFFYLRPQRPQYHDRCLRLRDFDLGVAVSKQDAYIVAFDGKSATSESRSAPAAIVISSYARGLQSSVAMGGH